MLFNSLQFLVFFPVVTALFFLLPHRYRPFLLLAASCWFYMAFVPAYILILAGTIVVDYLAGLAIEGAAGARRKWFLAASIVSNVGVLAFFKYYNFLNGNCEALARFLHWNYPIPALRILLPIGLSFHTFQAMSYTIEVYYGRQRAERDFWLYALYVMFYPQLVAGPIERPQNILHQFREVKSFDYERVTSGLRLMLWGFMKKILVADRLAAFVNPIFDHPRDWPGAALALAAVFFGFQIFCDFSGYTDIARGAARVMGYELMVNFDRPYAARSVPEFWKRWHISLSTWFRDYLYIPLGGNRGPAWKRYRNVFVVFLVSGLWHGASWNYVIWGALHGLYQLAYLASAGVRRSLASLARLDRHPAWLAGLGMVATFLLVDFAWIFFRAGSFADARYIASHLLSGWPGPADLARPVHLKAWWQATGLQKAEVIRCLAAIAMVEGYHWIRARASWGTLLAPRPVWLRWGLYYAALAALLFGGAYNSGQQFIYFQF